MMKKIILAASAAIVMFACSGDRVGPNTEVTGSENGTKAVQKETIYGVAQKGPFVNGNVVIYELDDKYEKTGKTFKGKTNDKGYFGIDITGGKLASPYIIIEASGKYVNEVTGKTTSDAITLKSVADVSNKENVNVNVLTDLESDKVIKLAKEGKSFEDAKSQAQGEVFKALGISESSVTRNSEDIALFGGNSSDSVLLVVSVSLQGNKTEAEVAGLLANLSGSGTFDVANGLKEVKNMSEVQKNIQALEPDAKVPNISGTTPKAPTTSTNTNPPKQTTPSTPSYTPPTSYNPPAQSNPVAQPAPTPVPPPVVIEKEKPICSKEITEDCVYKCGNFDYNPETHFCTRAKVEPKAVPLCGGKGYDTRTKVCENNIVKTLFTDARDGKVYKSVTIGDQVWMAENLNYYVPYVANTEGSVCQSNDEANCDKYGRLYYWSTAVALPAECNKKMCRTMINEKHQGICPFGWHLPDSSEWVTLRNYVGGSTARPGIKLKDKSIGGTDDYGFSALLGGYMGCVYKSCSIDTSGYWWSTKEWDTGSAYRLEMQKAVYGANEDGPNPNGVDMNGLVGFGAGGRNFLSSVRCIQNNPGSNPSVEVSKCGSAYYDPATHFCTKSNTPTVVEKCGGKGYDTRTNVCVNGTVQNALTLTFTDERDGKTYKYAEIGEQVWMAENLNYAGENGIGKCYDNKEANCDTYGRLYNWPTAMGGLASSVKSVQGICPAGWHLPSDAEWTALTDFAGGLATAGTKLKASNGWTTSSVSTPTDDYGFSALPGGYNLPNGFSNIGGYGRWWSATEQQSGYPYYRMMSYTDEKIGSSYYKGTDGYYSIRCVKGDGAEPSPSLICGDKYYYSATEFCSGTTIYSKCGGEEYNPSTEFCSSSKIYTLCGGKTYTPTSQFCYEGTTIAALCNKLEYNPTTEFCSSSKIYTLCGGKTYTPTSQFCYEGKAYSLCNKLEYNPTTEFCSSNKIYTLCDGKTYTPTTQYCSEEGTITQL